MILAFTTLVVVTFFLLNNNNNKNNNNNTISKRFAQAYNSKDEQKYPTFGSDHDSIFKGTM